MKTVAGCQNAFCMHAQLLRGFPCGSAGKESACNSGDLGLIPGLGRSSGGGKGYPFQYSGLENSMDCIIHGVTMILTRLSAFHFHFSFWVPFDLFDCQDPLSMGFSRQVTLKWVAIPFPRGSSYPGLNPCLQLGGWILKPPSHLGSPLKYFSCIQRMTFPLSPKKNNSMWKYHLMLK